LRHAPGTKRSTRRRGRSPRKIAYGKPPWRTSFSAPACNLQEFSVSSEIGQIIVFPVRIGNETTAWLSLKDPPLQRALRSPSRCPAQNSRPLPFHPAPSRRDAFDQMPRLIQPIFGLVCCGSHGQFTRQTKHVLILSGLVQQATHQLYHLIHRWCLAGRYRRQRNILCSTSTWAVAGKIRRRSTPQARAGATIRQSPRPE
jgi:hypothetical protein